MKSSYAHENKGTVTKTLCCTKSPIFAHVTRALLHKHLVVLKAQFMHSHVTRALLHKNYVILKVQLMFIIIRASLPKHSVVLKTHKTCVNTYHMTCL